MKFQIIANTNINSQYIIPSPTMTRQHHNYQRRKFGEYKKRDNRKSNTIHTWKRRINNFLCESIKRYYNINPKILIVDSIKRGSWNALTRYGFASRDIQTVNRTAEQGTRQTYNGELSDYFEENPGRTFDATWIDTINAGRNGSHLLTTFLTNHASKNCVVGVTITTRGREKHGNHRDTPSGYNRMVRGLCEKYEWECSLIDMPAQLRIKEQCGGKTIPKNWAYNGCCDRTGGAMTAFYRIKKE